MYDYTKKYFFKNNFVDILASKISSKFKILNFNLHLTYNLEVIIGFKVNNQNSRKTQ